jgi:nitroimidazol reductase NimA-like FMN-containing flavoprotein (pyridoxamine 5'-phosphate oxidase superfamily)
LPAARPVCPAYQEHDPAMDELLCTDRTTVRRLPKRAVYDRDLIHSILDEALICHVGFVADGQPYVIPTIHVRRGDRLCLHGSLASRMLNILARGLAVSLVDGLVLARSAFHHSMNYRSVVLFGTARVVTDPDEKVGALRAISEHLVKGRWQDVRSPTPAELKGTLVLGLPIDEASAKVCTGPPLDDEEDYALPVWAGVLPLKLTASEPVPDPMLPSSISPPSYATGYPGPGSA